MKMACAPLNLCVDMPEDRITSLILEQPSFFYSFISDIYAQINGASGTLVFSDANRSFSADKSVLLITQMIPFETNQKPLLNALYARMKKTAQSEELFLRTHEISSSIDAFIHTLAECCEEEIVWDHLDDITPLLKAASVRFNDEQPNLQDQLLDYMLACREYLGKQLFITVNLRSYLGRKEAEELFHSIILHKLSLLCLENREYPRIENEQRIIIDEDMCVI